MSFSKSQGIVGGRNISLSATLGWTAPFTFNPGELLVKRSSLETKNLRCLRFVALRFLKDPQDLASLHLVQLAGRLIFRALGYLIVQKRS